MNVEHTIARRGSVVAVVEYTPETFQRLFGGTVEDFKDFLLLRQGQLRKMPGYESRPARVVHVPFLEPCFERWLASQSLPGDPRQWHGRWALEAAADPDLMSHLHAQMPLLYDPPVEERLECAVWYLMLPLIIRNNEDAVVVTKPLPRHSLASFLAWLRSFLRDCPAFVPLSRLRGRGLALAAGDRLVCPAAAAKLAGMLEARVLKSMAAGEGLPEDGFIPLHRSWCGCRDLKKGRELPFLYPVFLPLVLAGAGAEVHFASNCLRLLVLSLRIAHSPLNDPSFGPYYMQLQGDRLSLEEHLGGMVSSLGLKGGGPGLYGLYSGQDAAEAAEAVVEECADLAVEAAEKPPERTGHAAHLRRVK
ncbi:MAG: hypothetical protein H5U02_01440 [Clostridia bacterium]|nr:hypothetical protein [Clostridia bacterium]